jgi:flagellar protein FlaJ
MSKVLKKLTSGIMVGIILGIGLIIVSSFFYFTGSKLVDSQLYYFLLGVSAFIIGLPFFLNLIIEGNREKNMEQMFLEFARDLVEGVKSGTPINKSIINLRAKDYGSLNKHVDKLANQISIGIPVKDALESFSTDIGSPIITRAISLIREAERSGGRIETILDSVTFSLGQIEKLKKERSAAIYSLTVQGYIVFIIFIVIMLVLQFKILPITSTLNIDASSGLGDIGGGFFKSGGTSFSTADFSRSFLFLLITQGFFAGLIIGKISEGKVKAGLKHSFILVILSWLISTGANQFLA